MLSRLASRHGTARYRGLVHFYTRRDKTAQDGTRQNRTEQVCDIIAIEIPTQHDHNTLPSGLSTLHPPAAAAANMQRIDPRPADAASSTQEGQQGQQQQTGRPGQWNIPTGFASTGRESHTQSFEEIYGVPENFLEIEVRLMFC